MVPGKVLSLHVDGREISVVYTQHFVDEYNHPYKYRKPVKDFIQEGDIVRMIREGLLEIEGYQSVDPDVRGIIVSAKSKLNMSFSVRATAGGFTLVMQNMMLKDGYTVASAKDYIIKVNPEYLLTFARGVDQEVRVAVIQYIGDHVDEFSDGEYYPVSTELVTFGVERHGNAFYIDYAEWVRDMLYVPV